MKYDAEIKYSTSPCLIFHNIEAVARFEAVALAEKLARKAEPHRSIKKIIVTPSQKRIGKERAAKKLQTALEGGPELWKKEEV